MHRILVIENDPAVRKLCLQALELKGYEVHAAGTGADVLAALQKTGFDLVLLGVTADEADGPDIVLRMKTAFPSLEVVVLGAENPEPSAAARCLRNGASDYVPGPLTPGRLVTAVEKAAGPSRRRKPENGSPATGNLVKLTEEMQRNHSKEELLAFILGHAASTLQADTGSLLVYEPRDNVLRIMSNIGQENRIGIKVRMGERIAGWVAQNRKPLLLRNPSELPQFKNWAANKGIASSIIVPLIQRSRLLGVICLNRHADRNNRTYTREDLDSLESFAIHSSFILSLQHQDPPRGAEEEEFS